jgi:hypothetical protein
MSWKPRPNSCSSELGPVVGCYKDGNRVLLYRRKSINIVKVTFRIKLKNQTKLKPKCMRAKFCVRLYPYGKLANTARAEVPLAAKCFLAESSSTAI